MISKENAEHYQWGDGCDSWVFVDKNDLSVKLEQMPKGTSEQWHFHAKAQQFFFILKGKATFYINDHKEIVKQNQGILIEPDSKHYIAYETDEVLAFLVISQPSTKEDRVNLNKKVENY